MSHREKQIDLKLARELLSNGMPMTGVAKQMKVSFDKLKGSLDPDWMKARLAKQKALRKNPSKKANLRGTTLKRKIDESAVIQMKANMPMDTRTTTEIICGDPLPGRSALDNWQPIGEVSKKLIEGLR